MCIWMKCMTIYIEFLAQKDTYGHKNLYIQAQHIVAASTHRRDTRPCKKAQTKVPKLINMHNKCIQKYTHSCIYAFVRTYIYRCLCKHMYICIRKITFTHASMDTYVSICIQSDWNTCAQTDTNDSVQITDRINHDWTVCSMHGKF